MATQPPTPPPTTTTTPYGERLFPVVVDEIAAQTPDKPFVLLPKTLDPAAGFDTVTYGDFARAVDRCARWLESELGRSDSFETLGFLSHGRDFRYPIFLFAAVKTGHKAQFSSPKNSIAAQLSLLQATDCRTFVVPADPLPITEEILHHRPMRTVTIPPLEVFLSPATAADDGPYPYARTFAEARFEPLVVLQTSGSTGIPKAIVATHGTFASMDAHHLLPALAGEETVVDLFRGCRWLNGFPFYHTGAYLFLLGYAIYYDITTVLPPPVVVSAELVDALHEHGRCDAAILPPSLIHPVFELPGGRDRLAAMKFVAYAGGPLPRKHGDLMSPHVRLVNLLGSTETAMYPIVTHAHDWEHVRYSDFLGHEFRNDRGTGDLHELVIVRRPHLDRFQGVFCTFPELAEYGTRELYKPHPTLPGLWKNAGRVDDVIAFSNGEKFNPVDTEKIVSGHGAVLACIATGRARFQAALIVEAKEPPDSPEAAARLLDAIWPVVEQANGECVGAGRVARDLVLFTRADKPLPRTEKGTIKRGLAEELYQRELDQLYDAAGDDIVNGSLFPRLTATAESPESYLTRVVALRSRKGDVAASDEFSQIGLDSLHFAGIVRDVNAFLEARGCADSPIGIGDVYLNSSVSKMVRCLDHRLNPSSAAVG